MNIDINAFLTTLPIGLYGMGGIFIVMITIYLVVKIIIRSFKTE